MDTNVSAAGLDHVSKKLKTIRRKFKVPTEPLFLNIMSQSSGQGPRVGQRRSSRGVVQVARVTSKLQEVKGDAQTCIGPLAYRGVVRSQQNQNQVGMAHMKRLAGASQENKMRRSWQNRQTLAQKLKCGSHAALDYVGLKTAPTDRQDAHSSARWVVHQACAWLSPCQQWCWEATNAQNSNSVHEEDPTKVLVQQRHSGPS